MIEKYFVFSPKQAADIHSCNYTLFSYNQTNFKNWELELTRVDQLSIIRADYQTICDC